MAMKRPVDSLFGQRIALPFGAFGLALLLWIFVVSENHLNEIAVRSYITSVYPDPIMKRKETGFEEISSIEIEVEDIGHPRPSGGLENDGAS